MQFRTYPDPTPHLAKWLTQALADRPEPYAANLPVLTHWPAPDLPAPPAFIVLRYDGGTHQSIATRFQRFAITTVTPTPDTSRALADLVAGLVELAVYVRAVPLAAIELETGPAVVADRTYGEGCMRYATFTAINTGQINNTRRNHEG